MASSSEGGGTSSGGGGGGGASGTFRERRLSLAQQADPRAKGAARNRRLSIYDREEELQGGVNAFGAPVSTCGCKSVGGLEPVPGGSTAKINQDRALAVYPFMGEKAGGLFGVFDGHGRFGETVSQFVIDTLPTVLAAHPLVHSQPGTALEDAFQSVDKQLASHCDAGVSGTTAVAALVRGNRMWLANAGDSRAILVRQKQMGGGKGLSYGPIDLTIDHKPDTPDEMRRILEMGGHVTPSGANGSPARVWHKLRGLAMSRSIGDHNAASVGVISKPEITQHEICDDDVALVLISDGVSELLSSQTVCDLVATVTNLDPQKICEKIVEQSTHMWKVEEGDYRDDITAVVLTFPWLDSYD
jgi:serine/threonine protein phosphatase PrpC